MKWISRVARSRPLVAACVGLAVGVAVVGLRRAGWFEPSELAAYDRFLRATPRDPSAPPVVVVGISDEDILTLGRWPLTDRTLARALRMILAQEPRAVGVDLIRDLPVPPGSRDLDLSWASDRRIVAVTKFGGAGAGPPPSLKGTEQVGFSDIVVDRGGTVRRGLLFLDDGVDAQSSLALRLALLYLERDGVVARPAASNSEHLQLGRAVLSPLEADDGPYVGADARGFQFFLDCLDRRASIPVVSLSDLLAGRLAHGLLRDKVVLIGTTSESVKDHFYTPLSQAHADRQHEFGVVLHAQIVGQLLRLSAGASTPLRALTEGQEGVWIVLWGVGGALMGLWGLSAWRFSFHAAGGLLVLFLAAYALFQHSWWVPAVPPAAAWLVSAGAVSAYLSAHERKERLLLMGLFSRHVSAQIAQTLWEQRDQFLAGGRPKPQELTATIFFSDLKGFTSASEALAPTVLVEWLNDYLEAMTRIVMEHEGVVDDYAGDGIKANFGVPLPRRDEPGIRRDAQNAVRCALAMGRELERLNREASRRDLPPVRIRIGIFTGPVVAGAIGSSERLKYTTIGDTVNTAARLESYDKEFEADAPCRILVGETTAALLGGGVQAFRVGEVSLRGRAGKTIVYRVAGCLDDGPRGASASGGRG